MDEVKEVLLCEVANEIEATLVVNMLKEDGIPAWSDASPATTAFGGLPFESGHRVFGPASMAQKAVRDPQPLPPLQGPAERPRARALTRLEP